MAIFNSYDHVNQTVLSKSECTTGRSSLAEPQHQLKRMCGLERRPKILSLCLMGQSLVNPVLFPFELLIADLSLVSIVSIVCIGRSSDL